ncbi:hypothetical protein [uncultured Robinsoniella sp.]|uniref:hypothetical protein n=1 Tax=uncultured Robinsoniella sp. TaxID=904190 RepID=UPI00374F0F40
MKAVLEEYAYVMIGIILAGLVLLFLLSGLKEGGFLEILARRFSSMVFGIAI